MVVSGYTVLEADRVYQLVDLTILPGGVLTVARRGPAGGGLLELRVRGVARVATGGARSLFLPDPQINISALVFCTSRCAELEFWGGRAQGASIYRAAGTVAGGPTDRSGGWRRPGWAGSAVAAARPSGPSVGRGSAGGRCRRAGRRRPTALAAVSHCRCLVCSTAFALCCVYCRCVVCSTAFALYLHRLRLVLPRPLPCVSTACAAKTAPLPCGVSGGGGRSTFYGSTGGGGGGHAAAGCPARGSRLSPPLHLHLHLAESKSFELTCCEEQPFL